LGFEREETFAAEAGCAVAMVMAAGVIAVVTIYYPWTLYERALA
jgi:hypothetical protein